MEKHYTLLKAAELLGVTTQTLRNWDNAGKINAIRTPGNQRRIPESEIARILYPAAGESADIMREPKRSMVEIQEKSNISDAFTAEMPIIITERKNDYLLMCKDTAVYDIKESLILNEGLIPGCLLKETMSFSQWMETRYSTETNFSAERLMQRAFGKYDHEHAAYATGALSLSDCYWIRQKDENILFMEITPYLHKEWDAMEAVGIQNDYIWGSLSNLFVSGKSDKRWIDAQTLLKVDSFGEIEPYALCTALGLENITEAQRTDEGIILSNFTSPDVFFESMEQSGNAGEDTDPRYTAVEAFKELAVALFVVDYLVENNDRHPDDYGYLRNSTTGEYITMAPYYNFDRAWSGTSIPLPENATQKHSRYIHNLCRRAINTANDFEYGTIIERRADELLKML